MTIQLTRADLSASGEQLGTEKANAILAAIFTHGSMREQARRYTKSAPAQRAFMRGYEAEIGKWFGPVDGSRDEQAGRMAAIRTFGLDMAEMRQRMQLRANAPLRSRERQHDASECPLFSAADEPRLL
ncbi:hypothetical protein S2M10_29510 [Sphingomonas sp. S2M10]|uniref:hypothetical protein n=1 Tax=Sphingomonas sp. S2M10 TaxID=2705010 RepID=UPI0014569378|nr:hypothetical protein [Sphingomonas sp. S2M10]NLS27949.1 hypothetical protein [Sphingomonas sp. S2M10]